MQVIFFSFKMFLNVLNNSNTTLSNAAKIEVQCRPVMLGLFLSSLIEKVVVFVDSILGKIHVQYGSY